MKFLNGLAGNLLIVVILLCVAVFFCIQSDPYPKRASHQLLPL